MSNPDDNQGADLNDDDGPTARRLRRPPHAGQNALRQMGDRSIASAVVHSANIPSLSSGALDRSDRRSVFSERTEDLDVVSVVIFFLFSRSLV